MKVLALVALVLFTSQSFAKMTKFSSKDAVVFVLSTDEVMTKIYKQSQTDLLLKVEVAEVAFNEFDVTLETAKLDWRCSTVVKVKTKKIIAQIPGGASISANELTTSKISKSDCVE